MITQVLTELHQDCAESTCKLMHSLECLLWL